MSKRSYDLHSVPSSSSITSQLPTSRSTSRSPLSTSTSTLTLTSSPPTSTLISTSTSNSPPPTSISTSIDQPPTSTSISTSIDPPPTSISTSIDQPPTSISTSIDPPPTSISTSIDPPPTSISTSIDPPSSSTLPPNKMNTSDNIHQIIKWILNQISFYGLQILLKLEIQFPIMESASSSSERLGFFTEIINMACNTSYNKSIICAIHNVIIMNDLVKEELLRKIDISELITQYKNKTSNKVGSSYHDKNLINIMPFTYECTNTNCQRQPLDIAFSRTGYIAYLISIKPCSIYIGTCKRCKYIYGPSSVLDIHTNQRIVTDQSIQKTDHIYFTGDLVYSRELLTMFSNNLIHAHTTFQGFAESYVSTLIDLHPDQIPRYSANAFSKRLETVWIYYELSRFIFVTSCEKSISFPKSLQPEFRSIFIERNLPFLSHVFTVFWSHHQMINDIKCKQSLCSRVMLIDGHQKCKRVICRFENVTNINHPEMGPVIQGCPYAPKRRKKDEKENGKIA
jgi:hypothetical protein